jgi:ubiquitin conjugation factor E4 B
MSDTTRVALSDAELQTNALSEDEEAGAPYGFICECFFLTARAMHLGYVKCAAEHTSLAREVQDRARQMEDVDAMRDSWAASIPGGPSQFQMAQFERRVGEMKAELERAKSNYAMFEATLLDPETLGEAARFYRLVAAWLRWVAEGRESDGKSAQERESVVSNGGGAFESLLPNPVPVSFAALPEHLVDDLAEFLLYVQRFARRGLSKAAVDAELSHCLDDFVNLFVLLLGSPQYVKNPYLRAKFVEILRGWLPGDPTDSRYEYVPRYAALFEGGNNLASTFLVPSLLRLYVDIEFTGAANQFYDKFNIRHQIGEMCEYLWRVETHRNAWSALAKNDGAFYVRFLNMLINDAIWLLDESMKKLPELREHAADVADTQAWHARPARERQEREAANRQNERALRSDLTLAKTHVGMMGYTSLDIASPFLVPEMVERVASMLNYFLLYLAGPERKQLKFADREKMKALAWDPPEMLGMIVDVYLHLFAADAEGAFVAAIAADGRAYRDEVFIETGRDFKAARVEIRVSNRLVRGARRARALDARRRGGGRGGPRGRARSFPRPHHVHAHDGPGASAKRRQHGPREHHAAPADGRNEPVHQAAAQGAGPGAQRETQGGDRGVDRRAQEDRGRARVSPRGGRSSRIRVLYGSSFFFTKMRHSRLFFSSVWQYR